MIPKTKIYTENSVIILHFCKSMWFHRNHTCLGHILFYMSTNWEKECLVNIISECVCEHFWGILTFELLDWELEGTIHSGGSLTRRKMQEKDRFVLFADLVYPPPALKLQTWTRTYTIGFLRSQSSRIKLHSTYAFLAIPHKLHMSFFSI